MFYFVKTPGWLKRIYDSYLWSMPANEKTLYLTFDDGPHPQATPFVLSVLKQYNALATFFCIGKNVVAYPGLYQQILNEGHVTGNHTYHHLNGWKASNDSYMKDIALASREINSNLFRPPYGRITSFQAKNLKAAMHGREVKVIMWDVLLTGGGIIPDDDMKKLNEMGVGKLFAPGTPTSEIASYISSWVTEHRPF